jgi:probable HAF family extracellular repeat protein
MQIWHPFLWQAGKMRDLASKATGDMAQDNGARAINEHGQIVGKNTKKTGTYAFVWQEGNMHDLVGDEAVAVNNNGWIIGRSDYTAALWTPKSSA